MNPQQSIIEAFPRQSLPTMYDLPSENPEDPGLPDDFHPYYVIYSRYSQELQVFRLVRNRYRMAALTNGRLLIPEVELSLGLWQGDYTILIK